MYSEIRARAEVRGPAVEVGIGEWAEVERLRGWWVRSVRGTLEEQEKENQQREQKAKTGTGEGIDVASGATNGHE